jgi:hypothetical protein
MSLGSALGLKRLDQPITRKPAHEHVRLVLRALKHESIPIPPEPDRVSSP